MAATMNPVHYHPYSTGELTSPPSPPDGYVGGGGGPLGNGTNNGSNGVMMANHHNMHHHHHHHHANNHHMTVPQTSPYGPGGHAHAIHHTHTSTSPNGGSINTNGSNGLKMCAGCGQKIVERFLLFALDRYWHNGCLKCECCHTMLADVGSSCFTRNGMILCKQDYMRMFGSSGACSACGQMIPASELVMKTGGSCNQGSAASPPNHQSNGPSQVFHLKCFACSKCGAHLVPGDRYYMLTGMLVCEQDWHKLLKGTTTPTTTIRKGKVGRPRRSRD